MSRFALVGVIALALLAPGAASAQEGKRYAILVGVNEYDHPKLEALKYAANDATEMADELEGAGYAVTLLTAVTGKKDAKLAPTKANIEAQIKAVLAKAAKGDTVLIGMAGHGLQFEGQKDSYFCPADGKPFKDQANTLVSLGGVYAEFDRSNAGVKVLLVDACRDDPVGGRGIDADTAPKPPTGVAALFSCRAGERAFEHKSLEHGVFFHHVLKGLRGEAVDKKGQVTFNGLAGYVTQEVSEAVPTLIGGGAKQSPNMKADFSNVPVLVPKGGGWKRLLDGKLDDTWAKAGSAQWTLTDGVLKATPGIGWLATKKDYTDFVLGLEYKLPENGNTGLFLRGWQAKNFYGDGLIEVQLTTDTKQKYLTGAIYGVTHPDAAPDAPADQWNKLRVAVVGDRVTVTINGTLCLDKAVTWKEKQGFVALQSHAKPSEFRNIRIRELTPEK